VNHVNVWLSLGSGQVFAAIVRLDSIDDAPPLYDTQAFADALVATTLINVGTDAKDYTGDFGDIGLAPGAYALIIGSGRFGATGNAALMTMFDGQIRTGILAWGGSYWGNLPDSSMNATLTGTFASVHVTPNPVAFPPGALGANQQQAITLQNDGAFPIQLGALTTTGTNAPMFSTSDESTCLGSPLAAGAQCTFTLNYTPQSASSHTADLRVVSNGSPNPLVVPLSGSSVGLLVTVDDDSDFAAYSSMRHYTVTVINTSGSTQGDIDVYADLSDQLDATAATWSCTSGCADSGTGALSHHLDSLAFPAGVIYTINVPVKADAAGPAAQVGVSAESSGIGPFTGSDTDTLVIFRDDFGND
jgi:hypothetical protein